MSTPGPSGKEIRCRLSSQHTRFRKSSGQLGGDMTQEKAVRYRRAKSDASVGAVEISIARAYGLPAGCVSLRKPCGSDMRSDATIGTLRAAWEEY